MDVQLDQKVRITTNTRRCGRKNVVNQIGTVIAIIDIGNGIPARYRVLLDQLGASLWFERAEFEPV